MKRFIVFSILIICGIFDTFAETCQKPEVVASAYVTEDATILTNVAFTTQFVLKCSNGVKGITLYAEVNGKSLPAARLSSDNKYQVSWTEDVKKARSGEYNIKLYDDERYAAIRKALRNGEDPNSVKPLVVVVLNNPGIYRGPWVNSELLAVLLAAVVSYSAFSSKFKLLA
ncbi:translocon-associated protein delta [Bombus vancouverensis nearcticus]|uniref:Translocon-associated protein subunit delta n=1 Tax=Bombus bifarius TaxID=103933 RepID=A0A6P8MCF7_9HYME|nr:translocon-associated protein subunit delta [Bombus vancouverensis nearcticus]XP_033300285.1 translocon-associated protein subunit delta [Bombus bifarius]